MPVKFEPFVFAIPDDWNHINDNGTLRANKNNEIRLNISIWDMTNAADYSLSSVFETIKAGYFNSDVNWAVYSRVTQNDYSMYQTLEYLEDPRLIIAVAEKTVNGKKLALIISFAGNSGKEIEKYMDTFTNVLENIILL
jgi:hypothetical protein